MNKQRFYRFVWRFNGIAIMGGIIAVLLVACYSLVEELLRSRPPQVIQNVADDPSGQEKWQLGYPQKIEGTASVYIPLISELEDIKLLEGNRKRGLHSYGDYESYSKPTRNILFIDTAKDRMRWLFPSNDQLVTQVQLLSRSPEYDSKRRIEAIMYTVIRKDTDGDGKLTTDDDNGIAFTMPDGSGYKEVLSSVDRLIDAMPLENGKLLILYQTHGTGYSLTLRLRDLSSLGKIELPKVPN